MLTALFYGTPLKKLRKRRTHNWRGRLKLPCPLNWQGSRAWWASQKN